VRWPGLSPTATTNPRATHDTYCHHALPPTRLDRFGQDAARRHLGAPNSRVPAADRANEYVVGWARGHGLVRSEAAECRLASVRLGDFAARVYPTAAVEDLLLTADWIAWLDFLDDQNDDRRIAPDPQGFDGFLARVADVAATGACDAGTGPIGEALTDLWARTRARAGSTGAAGRGRRTGSRCRADRGRG
jgi:hypothetical protein